MSRQFITMPTDSTNTIFLLYRAAISSKNKLQTKIIAIAVWMSRKMWIYRRSGKLINRKLKNWSGIKTFARPTNYPAHEKPEPPPHPHPDEPDPDDPATELAKAESSLSVFIDPQLGHLAGSAESAERNSSKRLPQSRHTYSKMGKSSSYFIDRSKPTKPK